MSEEYEDIKIVALMSVPTVGWNHHWGQVYGALQPFKIPLRLGFGAFWHQTMSNLLEDCIDDGIDWALTLDFDSMFRAEHVDQLIGHFGTRPDIDAIAALQCKRSTDEVPLMTAEGMTQIELTDEPAKVSTAHFGLTLIRLDALKKMPKPWFLGTPDPEGSYRTDRRLDPDIAFWHKWRETGNSLYVDLKCSIGHLQPLVSEFGPDGKARHVHIVQWRKANPVY
jgi:hypothetical protein